MNVLRLFIIWSDALLFFETLKFKIYFYSCSIFALVQQVQVYKLDYLSGDKWNPQTSHKTYTDHIQNIHIIITLLGSCSQIIRWSLKDGLLLKIKYFHIHLNFKVTQYLWNYAHVEDIANWTRSYILIIIYRNGPKNISWVSLERFLVTAGNVKVGKPRFFFKTQHRFLH